MSYYTPHSTLYTAHSTLIIGKLPKAKAVGPCGWSNDEIKALPETCIRDLIKIFGAVLSTGFGPGMMMAKTVLLSIVHIPLSMHHARPIAILSCLCRLLGKFVFGDHCQRLEGSLST